MTFNMKTLLLLALSMMSMAAATRHTPSSLRKLKEEEGTGSDIKLTRFKGKDSSPDEVDLDVILKTCKKDDSDECDAIVGDEEAKEVSMAKFASMLADDMVGALDDEDDRRNLQDRDLYTCYYYYYCGYYYCYYRYICV